MRTLIVAALSAALCTALSACATSGGPSRYSQEMDRLKVDCDARDGILVSTGAMTGRPATDNVCQINGPASRIPTRN